jgi:DNA polymerase elongation subunit (family B)/rubredoxin
VKLLMLDIETAPHLAAVWGLWGENIPIDRLLKPGYTLCWAAKWHGEKEVHFDSTLSGHRKMIRGVHKLLAEADAVCHYNGLKFDIPTLNKEFLLLGLKPPAPYKNIDLYTVVKRRFRMASNKLDFVAQQLELGEKVKHRGFQLWLDCMNKKPEAMQEMETYNRQDVVLLERVYDYLLPWIPSHPNRSVYDGHSCCPNCGSEKSQARGYAVANTIRYQRFQCQDCGTWYRKPNGEATRDRRIAVNA